MEYSKSYFFRAGSNEEFDLDLRFVRVIIFAENILNFKGAPQFEAVIRKFRTSDAEAAYAELEVAKLLNFSGTRFWFNSESGVRGLDYDLLVQTSGINFSADTKCKLEITNYSSETLLSSLKQARNQLKADLPGIVFVTCPQAWHDVRTLDPNLIVPEQGKLDTACNEFFCGRGSYKGTGHVVLVVFYFSPIVKTDGLLGPFGLIREYVNPKHRFPLTGPISVTRNVERYPDRWINLRRMCSDATYRPR